MRAVQVVSLTGPAGSAWSTCPNRDPSPGDVVVDVPHRGRQLPDLLPLSCGKYQLKPELPFTLGVDFAGVVRSACGRAFRASDRSSGWRSVGADAEVLIADPQFCLRCPTR